MIKLKYGNLNTKFFYKNYLINFNTLEYKLSNFSLRYNFDNQIKVFNNNLLEYIQKNNKNIYRENNTCFNTNRKYQNQIYFNNKLSNLKMKIEINLIQKQLFQIMKKNISYNFETNSLNYLEDIPKNINELERYRKKNTINIDQIMNNLSVLLNYGEKFNFEIFSLSLFVNKFSDHSDKKKKIINNDLLSALRHKDYLAINNKNFQQNKFIKLAENLHMARLNEADKELIQNKYFEFKEANKISLENKKNLLNLLHFYQISGNKLNRIKNDLFNEVKNNYFNLSNDELYFYNSCLIFHNSKDLGIFIEPLYKRLDLILDVKNGNKYYHLEQKIFNYLPIPKIIGESKNFKNKKILNSKNSVININENSTSLINIDNLDNINIYENALVKIENFLLSLTKKEDISVEFLIPLLSNTFNYLELKNEIFELFVGKLYQNIASLTNDNMIELLFLIFQVSKNDKDISQAKKKLTIQLINCLKTIKTEPKIFIDVDKFYIYLNDARNNLNLAFEKFCSDCQIIEINHKNNYDLFKKLIRISLDIFPFSVKDKEYSPQLLKEIFISLNKILNNK